MTVVLDKGSSHKERQKKLLELEKKRQLKRCEVKKRIVEETFGSVLFDKDKTALEIYKEMCI